MRAEPLQWFCSIFVKRNEAPAGDKRNMQFILGVVLFIGVIGVIDARIPWPRCAKKDGLK